VAAQGVSYELHVGGGPLNLGDNREIYVDSVGHDSSRAPIASIWMGVRGSPGGTPTPDFLLHVGESRSIDGVGMVTLVSINSGLGGSRIEVIVDLDN